MFNVKSEQGSMVGVVILTVLAGIITGSLGLLVVTSLGNTQKVEQVNLRQVNADNGIATGIAMLKENPCGLRELSSETLNKNLPEKEVFFDVKIEMTKEGTPANCIDADLVTVTSTGFYDEEEFDKFYEEGGGGHTVLASFEFDPEKISKTPEEVVQVNSGGKHSAAVSDDGVVFTWGLNDRGQLGTGDKIYRVTPQALVIKNGNEEVFFKEVSAGDGFTIALDEKGRVWAWGDNSQGQLGNNSNTSSLTPLRVSSSGVPKFDQISAGSAHSLALGTDKSVWAWGKNSSGQLGVNSTNSSKVPVKVRNGAQSGGSYLRNVTQVSAGGEHSLAIVGGRVYSWGLNSSGQLGIGNTSSKSTPALVGGITNVVEVSAGERYSLGLDNIGKAYGWGKNNVGQLGIGTVIDSLTPTLIDH